MQLSFSINELLSITFPDKIAGSEIIETINKKTEAILPIFPFTYITNFQSATSALAKTPYWISYGGSRTGSTYILLLLETLLKSLSQTHLKGWEGDFNRTSSFFETIESSTCIKSGLLKIHRQDQTCDELLHSGKAKAIISMRDYPSIAKSWKRVFFSEDSQPSDNAIVDFIGNEIENDLKKRNLPNTIYTKYHELEKNDGVLINRISKFMGISLHNTSVNHITTKLSKGVLRKVQSQIIINSSGHDAKTFLHEKHISDHEYEDARITCLVKENFSHQLDEDGYLRETQ